MLEEVKAWMVEGSLFATQEEALKFAMVKARESAAWSLLSEVRGGKGPPHWEDGEKAIHAFLVKHWDAIRAMTQ